MCGIVGIYDPKRNTSDHKDIIDRILPEIKHRGPNSTGTSMGERNSLAAVRLSIVDAEGGSNPLVKDGVIVAFNGEIFNWKELRTELEALGYTFKTDCDTEILPAAWKAWGKEFPKRLEGMFSILLNDTNTNEFVVVTDPTGIKPLYYVNADKGRKIYCSETYPLQDLSSIPGQVNKVRPGQIIVNGEATTYFDIQNPPLLDKPPTVEEIQKLVVESIEMCLPPKGEKFSVFLSGGLDSGAIASICAGVLGRKEDMVVIISGREGSPDAEGGLKLAREELKLDESKIIRAPLNPEQVFKDLPDIVKHFGQYDFFQIANGINFWYCSKETRDLGIKVALCGDGSDEIFGGYFHYLDKIEQFRPDLYKNNTHSDDDLRAMQEYAMRCCLMRLHAERNACVDSMSMAHSVEVRPPFLMLKLIIAALSIPMDDKIDIRVIAR